MALTHVTPHHARRLLAATSAAALGSLLTAPCVFADALTPESGGSPNADKIDTLYKLVFAIAVVVLVGVTATLVYSLVRFRARKGMVAAQIHGNTRLEIGWTVGAAAVLVVVTVVTFVMLGGIKNPSASDRGGLAGPAALYASVDQSDPPDDSEFLRIKVTGLQFLWRFDYPKDDPDSPLPGPYTYEEMVVPEKTTVVLDIEAQDVAHSWWIPKLGGKADGIPGEKANKTWFKAPRAGVVYEGNCAELCGRGHANMTGRVRVVTVPEYQAWLDGLKRDLKAANEAAARQREQQQGGNAPTE